MTGQDLFWIEKSNNFSYKIIKQPKKFQTEQITVFESNKEISGIAIGDKVDIESNNTGKTH